MIQDYPTIKSQNNNRKEALNHQSPSSKELMLTVSIQSLQAGPKNSASTVYEAEFSVRGSLGTMLFSKWPRTTYFWHVYQAERQDYMLKAMRFAGRSDRKSMATESWFGEVQNVRDRSSEYQKSRIEVRIGHGL